MITMAVFGLVVIIMICGGMLLARLATVARSKGSWMWGCFILILLICVPLFLIGLGVWFLHFSGISSRQFSPFG
ncbi:hypothetical protein C6503_21010 [Candidatus Poribacteria bacterium]|nr:MAG: hypothetical protein C6503_21010 [Candidatus Poribacteria bacterium]